MFRPLPLLLLAVVVFAVGGCVVHPDGPPPHHILHANALPLALDDAFEFRKSVNTNTDPVLERQAQDETLNFERNRNGYDQASSEERRAQIGHYIKLWWRAKRPADLIVRLEYRQTNLAAYLQAQEVPVHVSEKLGTYETVFQIVGNDYFSEGLVTCWRAVLIEHGKIVAETQSFLWH